MYIKEKKKTREKRNYVFYLCMSPFMYVSSALTRSGRFDLSDSAFCFGAFQSN